MKNAVKAEWAGLGQDRPLSHNIDKVDSDLGFLRKWWC